MKKKTLKIAVFALIIGLGSGLVFAAKQAIDDQFPILNKLQAIRDELKLTDAQKELWKAAEEATRATVKQMHENHLEVEQALSQELEKADPDLASVSAQMDEVQLDNLAARRNAREQWLKFYEALDENQQAVVNEFLKTRLEKMAALREKITRFINRSGILE